MDHHDALNAIISTVQDAWAAGAAAAAGTTSAPRLLVQGLDEMASPEATTPNAPYGRLYVTHVLGAQASLGGTGTRLFDRAGQVLVQVFAPMNGGRGIKQSVALAAVVLNAVEGREAGTIWFRNASLVQRGPIGPFYQANVIAEFEWSAVK